LSYCPRSSLPAHVLAWPAGRLASLLPPRPSGQGGTPPLPLEVRLDAVAAVILDGLSYRRAGRMVGISKTEVGDSMDLLVGKLADLGYCQPDGTFVVTLQDLRERLGEMAEVGEAACVDGLATRVQRPREWANQKVLYDAKCHGHTVQGLVVPTVWGDLLWLDGGWPGSCHEHELLALSGLAKVVEASGVATLLDRGFRGWPSPASTGMRQSGIGGPKIGSATGSGRSTACRPGCAHWWSRQRPPRRWLVVAPLARAAVPRPGRLPGCWRADLPRPLGPPGPHVKQHHGHPL
jgi:DDE superfamily endonuclease